MTTQQGFAKLLLSLSKQANIVSLCGDASILLDSLCGDDVALRSRVRNVAYAIPFALETSRIGCPTKEIAITSLKRAAAASLIADAVHCCRTVSDVVDFLNA